MLNSGLFFIAMLTVLLGTLYPLIFDAFHWGEISVGPPYFNKVLLPLLIVTLILMGLAPLCEWKDQSLFSLYQKAIKKILLSMLIAGFFIFSLMSSFSFFVFMMLSFNIMSILSVMSFLRLRPGMALAHTGFAIFLMGILLSSLLSQERDVRMQPGNTVQLGPYQFIFLDTQGIQASNYRGIRAAFEVVKNEHHVAMLYPEKRIYTVRDSVMTKVAIQPGLFRDLYIALGEPLNDNDWTVRIYYKPFIRWIWFGGLLIMLGGIFSVMRKKHACAN
jgi:cytochrome c-type biogenesis protein CcmF